MSLPRPGVLTIYTIVIVISLIPPHLNSMYRMMDVNGVYCHKDVVRDMTLVKITLQHIPSAAAVVCLNGATVAIAAAQCTTADALEVQV